MNRWGWCLAAVLAGCGGGDELAENGCALLGPAAFAQGELRSSDSPLDLALDGPGFFVLAKGEARAYTRLGHFTADAEGHVLGPRGYRLQSLTQGSAHPVDLILGPTVHPPSPTTQLVVKANLNADASVKSFDPRDPAATSEFQSTLPVFDPLGRTVMVDLYWVRPERGAWAVHALVDGSSVNGGTSGMATEIARATLDFDTNGRLVAVRQESFFEPLGQSNPQPLTFVFGDPTSLGGSGLQGVTQFAGSSSTWFTAQDGAGVGFLRGFEFNAQGTLMLSYSNGAWTEHGRLALTNFEHPMGLRLVRDELLVEGLGSGAALPGLAGEGGFGALVPSALEVQPEPQDCH